MKAGTFILLALTFSIAGCNEDYRPGYAPVKTESDNYFGIEIQDPYRYMENMDDTVFLSWMKEYAAYSRKMLDEIPGRNGLTEQMQVFDQRKSDKIYWLKIAENGRYFYLKSTPKDEKSKLYYRDSYFSEEILLLDPDSFSNSDGDSYVINSLTPDPEGEQIAIGLAPNGSESMTMIIMDVKSGRVLQDRIELVFSEAAWSKGGSGFFYSKTNSDDVHDQGRFLNTKVYYHKIGDQQHKDVLIYSAEKYPELGMKAEEVPVIICDIEENDYYLQLATVNRYEKVFHAHEENFDPHNDFTWRALIKPEDMVQGSYARGDDLFLYTARNTPGFQVLKTSKSHPDINDAEVVVPENELGMISGFAFTNNSLYYKVKINGVEERLFRIPDGSDQSEEIELPAKAGYLSLETRGYKFSDVWIGISGWTVDGKRYRFSPIDYSFTPEPLSSEAEFPEFDDLVVEELMVPSYDGVMVPLSLIYKKGTALDGSAPILINCYGAYGISRTPVFSPNRLIWTLHGGVFASAHVRGGGELGDSWRLGGHKTSKPNSWKDLIACTEYLINNKYSSREHIAIYGGSAGGIVIGRAMTERPDLFAAAISHVGVMNPLRIEQSPNGPMNAPEFGTVKDSVECMALLEMDAYQNIDDGVHYPATLITAGFNDPRVIVWQPAKFTARLQAANRSKNPVLFDVDYSSGHGNGDPKSKVFEDYTDLFSFAFWQTGNAEFQKK